MKILISCLCFGEYTGSELYVYELAKALSEQHEVHIVSRFGGELADRISAFGVKCFSFDSPPNYFLGNGYTKYRTSDGEQLIPTAKNIFYKVSDEHHYDLVLANHKPLSEPLLGLYNSPVINIVHSEIISYYEDPITHQNVIGYIAIRESIKDHLIFNWGIDSSSIKTISNPFDCSRFNTENVIDYKQSDYYLFVGSYDYLRKNAIWKLINKAKKENKKVYLVGRGYDDSFPDHVNVFPPMWDVEGLVKGSYMVCSILMGRTAIEGHLCGKHALIYDVNNEGEVRREHISVVSDTETWRKDYCSKHIANKILEYSEHRKTKYW